MEVNTLDKKKEGQGMDKGNSFMRTEVIMMGSGKIIK